MSQPPEPVLLGLFEVGDEPAARHEDGDVRRVRNEVFDGHVLGRLDFLVVYELDFEAVGAVGAFDAVGVHQAVRLDVVGEVVGGNPEAVFRHFPEAFGRHVVFLERHTELEIVFDGGEGQVERLADERRLGHRVEVELDFLGQFLKEKYVAFEAPFLSPPQRRKVQLLALEDADLGVSGQHEAVKTDAVVLKLFERLAHDGFVRQFLIGPPSARSTWRCAS